MKNFKATSALYIDDDRSLNISDDIPIQFSIKKAHNSEKDRRPSRTHHKKKRKENEPSVLSHLSLRSGYCPFCKLYSSHP